MSKVNTVKRASKKAKPSIFVCLALFFFFAALFVFGNKKEKKGKSKRFLSKKLSR